MTDVTKVPVDFEYTPLSNTNVDRVLYFAYQPIDHEKCDVGIRVIFIVGESLANVLMFGDIAQDGVTFTPCEVSVQVAGSSDLSNEEAGRALVTLAVDLVNLYIDATGDAANEVHNHDPLTLDYLPIDIPHTWE